MYTYIYTNIYIKRSCVYVYIYTHEYKYTALPRSSPHGSAARPSMDIENRSNLLLEMYTLESAALSI